MTTQDKPRVNPAGINYRAHPEKYRVGRGEQGVLTVEPYKSELLPHWRFRTPDVARASAATILQCYHAYKKQEDFVGMDMARKFLQMGVTRSRRYANHASGRKYAADGRVHPREENAEKAECAAIFAASLQIVKRDADYQRRKAAHLKAH